MYRFTQVSIIISALVLVVAHAKIYGRCELARELRNFDVAEDELPTWVCIAQHESDYNTSAMNPGSGDHGLFQISQIYWCSPPGSGYGCNAPCSKFRDDDIADDLQCIRRIYNEHKRISGNGFDAWVVYPLHCKGDTSRYILGCFDEEPSLTPDISSNATENEIPEEEYYSDGYQFPPLPSFSKSKHEDDVSQDRDFGDGYDFPKLPFNKVSIHDSLSLKDAYSNKISSFPYSKQSIHNFIPIPTENPSTFEEEENIYDFPSLPIYSKQSIHHFVPVTKTSKDEDNEDEEQSEKINSEYDFPPLPIISKKTSIYSEINRGNELGYNQEDTTKTESTTLKQFRFSSKLSTTLPYKTIQRKTFPTTLPTTTLQPQKSTSVSKHVFSISTVPTTTNQPTVTTTKSFTFKTFPIRLKTENPKYSTFSIKPFIFTTKAPTESVTKITTQKPFTLTTKTPVSFSNLPVTFTTPLPKKSSAFSFKPFATNFKPTHAKSSFVYDNFSNNDLQGSSSTPTPLVIDFKPVTTPPRPLNTFKPFVSTFKQLTISNLPVTLTSPSSKKSSAFSFKPFVTNFKPKNEKLSFVPYNFSNNDLRSFNSTIKPPSVDFKPVTTTLKPLNAIKPFSPTFKSLNISNLPVTFITPVPKKSSAFSFKPFVTNFKPMETTTSKPYRNYSSASYTTNAPQKPTPTSYPSAKQLTFAPDSFFSWIFGSQTLPPIVPPVPPSRRPPGERPGPGLPPRPPRPERPPGSLPRPPILDRPGRPMMIGMENLAHPQPGRRPSGLPKPFGPHKRPFTTEQLFGQPLGVNTTPLVPITTPTSTSRNTISSKSTYQDIHAATTPLPKLSGRSDSDNEHKEVEVMLDNNFVFIRTKFGYRLFRNS